MFYAFKNATPKIKEKRFNYEKPYLLKSSKFNLEPK